MHDIVTKIIETYGYEKKLLPRDAIKNNLPILQEKLPVFVSLYDGKMLVACCGKVYPTCDTVFEELRENTLEALKDPRLSAYNNNPEKLRSLTARVDIFYETDRRLLHHPDEITPDEGIILLCQKQGKICVILPHISDDQLSGQELYRRLAHKIQLDNNKLGKGDIILYGLKTRRFESGTAEHEKNNKNA